MATEQQIRETRTLIEAIDREMAANATDKQYHRVQIRPEPGGFRVTKKGHKDIVVNTGTDLTGKRIERDLTGLFDIAHNMQGSWPKVYADWYGERHKAAPPKLKNGHVTATTEIVSRPSASRIVAPRHPNPTSSPSVKSNAARGIDFEAAATAIVHSIRNVLSYPQNKALVADLFPHDTKTSEWRDAAMLANAQATLMASTQLSRGQVMAGVEVFVRSSIDERRLAISRVEANMVQAMYHAPRFLTADC